MTADCFLDTNFLFYSSSAAPADRPKIDRAQILILNTRFAVSAQVIQAFIASALRKKERGIRESNIDAFLRLTTPVPDFCGLARALQVQPGLRAAARA